MKEKGVDPVKLDEKLEQKAVPVAAEKEKAAPAAAAAAEKPAAEKPKPAAGPR